MGASSKLRWLAALVVIAISTPAWADKVAAAEALFQEARKLMDEGKWEEACPKLEESLRLDPGMGTRWHLARCYEQTRRLASAWAKYLEVADAAKLDRQKKREQAARRAAKRLEPKLSRLAIEVPREARIDGLVVVRNGVEVGPGAWGTKVPVDAGKLLIRASAPDREAWTKEIVVEPDQKLITVTVPRLRLAAKEQTPDPSPDVFANPQPVVAPPAVEEERAPWYEDRLGWVITGSGAAVLGVGIGSLLHGNSLADQSQMPGPLEEREDQADRADTFRTLGAALLIAGGGAAVAGAIKLAIPGPGGKSEESEAVSIRPSIDCGDRSILVGVGATF